MEKKKKRKKKKKNCVLEGEETSLLMLWAYTHTGIYSIHLSPYVHTLDICCARSWLRKTNHLLMDTCKLLNNAERRRENVFLKWQENRPK